MHARAEGNDVFLVMDDGTKQLCPPAFVNFNITITAALDSGEIVSVAAALSVARAEKEYWKRLADERGEQLANLRGGG